MDALSRDYKSPNPHHNFFNNLSCVTSLALQYCQMGGLMEGSSPKQPLVTLFSPQFALQDTAIQEIQ